MIVYKVVAVSEGRMWSLLAGSEAVEYFLGKETVPTYGKLLAFSSHNHAESFKNACGGSVFLARAPVARVAGPEDRISSMSYRDIWRTLWTDSRCNGTCRLPAGTVFCDTIRLMKRL